MAQIKTGTVSVTSGSNTVTGSGTTWLTDGVQAGDGFVLQTSSGVTGAGVYYTVAGVASNTSLTLTANWGGATASGAAYIVHTDFIAAGYPAFLPGDLEVKPVMNRNVLKLVNDKADSADLGTAAAADLTTSPTDTTAGRVLKVGAGYQQMDANLYRKGNILGTVSQSGGVPTGAIIERGSNANGEYVRFADGTLICTQNNFRLDYYSSSELRNVWSFPHVFVEANPAVSATSDNFASDAEFPYTEPYHLSNKADLSTLSLRTVLLNAVAVSGDKISFSLTAIGRWY